MSGSPGPTHLALGAFGDDGAGAPVAVMILRSDVVQNTGDVVEVFSTVARVGTGYVVEVSNHDSAFYLALSAYDLILLRVLGWEDQSTGDVVEVFFVLARIGTGDFVEVSNHHTGYHLALSALLWQRVMQPPTTESDRLEGGGRGRQRSQPAVYDLPMILDDAREPMPEPLHQWSVDGCCRLQAANVTAMRPRLDTLLQKADECETPSSTGPAGRPLTGRSKSALASCRSLDTCHQTLEFSGTVYEIRKVGNMMGSRDATHAIMQSALQAMGLISNRHLDGNDAGPLLYYLCQSRAYPKEALAEISSIGIILGCTPGGSRNNTRLLEGFLEGSLKVGAS